MKITIPLIHTNDLHCYFKGVLVKEDGVINREGGYARVATVVEELKSDNFGGRGDSLHAYHYHQWPVNLEGMLNLGHPNTSLQVIYFGLFNNT